MINRNYSCGLLIILLFTSLNTALLGQKKGNTTPKKPTSATTGKQATKQDENSLISGEELESYKQKVGRMVSFLEFALNTVASDSTAAEDKEVIINKSYLKFFADPKVQIEDDLDDKRTIVTYKNVQSYLQDLDYFYKDAKFEFTTDAITSNFSDPKKPYFIAEITRYLKGISATGDSVRNSKKRYIEINLDTKTKDLKIASIYTTRYNEDQALQEWWNTMDPVWKKIFSDLISVTDSVKVPHLKRLLMTDSLDVSKMNAVRTLEALTKFTNLKYLNISSTPVSDLTPIRNLVNLESLNCSFTPVTSLLPLKYTLELKDLVINNTNIIDLSPVINFKKLVKIDIHSTPVSDMRYLSSLAQLEVLNAYSTPLSSTKPLAGLKKLKYLNISSTGVRDIDSLQNLASLTELDLSFTKVTDLLSLQHSKQLSVLNINNTLVNSLAPLSELSNLKKVYCDNTLITKEDAAAFMNRNPKVLVIYQSVGLFEWWKNLDPVWQGIFRKYVSVRSTPTVEEMATIANLPEIDVSSMREVKSLAPLKPLRNLKKLFANNTSIESIYDIENLTTLEVIEVTSTQVRDVSPLSGFTNLKRLNVDNTPIKQEQLDLLVKAIPQCLVIYKTAVLATWWDKLAPEWKDFLQKYFTIKTLPPSTIVLHQMVESDSIKIDNNNKIKDLSPLTEFITLHNLDINNCMVENITPLAGLMQLEKLRLSKNPIKRIEGLRSLANLKTLDLENTGVSDIEVLQYLGKLENVKLAGTPIKDIKELAKLPTLTHLDISSTLVSSLAAIEDMTSLKELKCYNSKISQGKVDKFKKKHPDCEVIFY